MYKKALYTLCLLLVSVSIMSVCYDVSPTVKRSYNIGKNVESRQGAILSSGSDIEKILPSSGDTIHTSSGGETAKPVDTRSVEEKMFDFKIKYLQTLLQDGKYFNHYGDENGLFSVSDIPCTWEEHMNVWSGNERFGCCNVFEIGDNMAIQCAAYTNEIAFFIYNQNPFEWQYHYGSEKIDLARPGAVIRLEYPIMGMHSIFVTGVEGDTITYTDVNYDYTTCIIRWDVTVTKAELLPYFANIKFANTIEIADTTETP